MIQHIFSNYYLLQLLWAVLWFLFPLISSISLKILQMVYLNRSFFLAILLVVPYFYDSKSGIPKTFWSSVERWVMSQILQLIWVLLNWTGSRYSGLWNGFSLMLKLTLLQTRLNHLSATMISVFKGIPPLGIRIVRPINRWKWSCIQLLFNKLHIIIWIQ